MVSRSRVAALAFAALAACRTAPPRPAAPAAAAPPAQDFLVRRSAFTGCELEGFMALTAARNALVFHATKESLVGDAAPASWRSQMVEDLFARKDRLDNHASFAAEKFYACADREQLGLAKNPGAWVCLARVDIVFFLDTDRRKGRPREEAVARFEKTFAAVPKEVYPDELVEKLAPMVYRISSDEDEYDLRRFVFETCLFPDDWKRWWDAVGSKRG